MKNKVFWLILILCQYSYIYSALNIEVDQLRAQLMETISYDHNQHKTEGIIDFFLNQAHQNRAMPCLTANQDDHPEIKENIKLFLNQADKSGTTVLMAAAYHGRERIVKRLIELHANVNYDKSNCTPLYSAALSDNPTIEIVALLLKSGADINWIYENGTTPVYAAAEKGHDDIVTLLIESRANINLASKNGMKTLKLSIIGPETGFITEKKSKQYIQIVQALTLGYKNWLERQPPSPHAMETGYDFIENDEVFQEPVENLGTFFSTMPEEIIRIHIIPLFSRETLESLRLVNRKSRLIVDEEWNKQKIHNSKSHTFNNVIKHALLDAKNKNNAAAITILETALQEEYRKKTTSEPSVLQPNSDCNIA